MDGQSRQRLQSTYIWQHKPAFRSPYSGPFSLAQYAESTQGVPLSNLTGMGAFYNGEITCASGTKPIAYRVRMFVRQTWGPVSIAGVRVHWEY